MDPKNISVMAFAFYKSGVAVLAAMTITMAVCLAAKKSPDGAVRIMAYSATILMGMGVALQAVVFVLMILIAIFHF